MRGGKRINFPVYIFHHLKQSDQNKPTNYGKPNQTGTTGTTELETFKI